MLCKYTQSTLDLCYMATHLLLLISLLHLSYMHFRKKWALNHVSEKNIQFFKERVHSPLACSVANFSSKNHFTTLVFHKNQFWNLTKALLHVRYLMHITNKYYYLLLFHKSAKSVGNTESLLLISLHLILFLLLEWAECPLSHRTFP